ncbi:MAG: hypothetical protein DMF61_08140 [Blastocatellia bacterium AA13]|nr:MAG: hypothetical protein DMF61_08140 [Blastocatellia bacterium AA13]
MGQKSAIEWTEATWNPVRGCSRISEGCRFCYAERIASRFSGQGMAFEGYAESTKEGPRWTGKVTLLEESLELPLRWRKPRRIFVNSMSDLFHEQLPLECIQRVFAVMQEAHWHQFQILTKRSARLVDLSPQLLWSPNIWMGVSVESREVIGRIDDLRNTGARVKFLSLEPLIEALPNLDLRGIAWIIVGGESGPGSRPMAREWVADLIDQAAAANVAFFFKQWGGVNKKRAGRQIDGRTWDEMPASPNF